MKEDKAKRQRVKAPRPHASAISEKLAALEVVRGATPLMIRNELKAGIPAARVLKFQKESGLPLAELSALIGLPKRDRTSGRNAPLTSDQSQRLHRLATAFSKAVELFEGDVGKARDWFTRPATAFDGTTPLAMTDTEVGAREVESLIGRLEHGVFA